MKKLLAIMLILAMCTGHIAFAAEDTETASIQLTIAELFDLVIASSTVSASLSGSALQNAYTAGEYEFSAGYPTLSINANEGWYLKVRALNSTFSYSGSGSDPSKPVSDLSMKDAGTSHVATGWDAYNAISTSDQTFADHTAGVSAESHPCQFKVALSETTDIPGTYSLDVRYTLTTTP
ncbi:hypothetical protein ACFL4O_00795 [bacterium]